MRAVLDDQTDVQAGPGKPEAGDRPIALLILGTGGMAGRHLEQFSAIPGCTIVAACDVNATRAKTFAELHGIAHVFDDLGKALEWGCFDAVINATPDGVHKATSLEIIAAGKPIYCEKPLATNAPDAFEMVDAVEEAGLINMVNLTYRHAHALQHARNLIAAGEIGTVRHVEASYLQSWLVGRHWGDWRTDERWLWRLSSSHGSKGVLGDIGIHILDFVTYGTGLDIAALQARLKTFDKAEGGAIGAYTLDANDSVAMTVEFDNGALGVIHMSRFATGKTNELDLTIHGDRGALKIWANTTDSSLQGCLGPDIETQTWRSMECSATPINAERFVMALRADAAAAPGFRRAAELQKLLDLCFVSSAERRMLDVA